MYCRSCDYNLQDLPTGTCPECARAFDPSDRATFEDHPRHVRRVPLYQAGIASALALGAVAWLGWHSPLILIVFSMAATAAALACSIFGGPGFRRPGRWIGLTTLPGLLALAAFYSLALHMHARLGGWPDFYGTGQLPPELVTHARITMLLWGQVLLLALAMPLVLAVFALVPRLRPGLIYPAFLGAACWAGLLLSLCAPSGFLNWWWD